MIVDGSHAPMRMIPDGEITRADGDSTEGNFLPFHVSALPITFFPVFSTEALTWSMWTEWVSFTSRIISPQTWKGQKYEYTLVLGSSPETFVVFSCRVRVRVSSFAMHYPPGQNPHNVLGTWA